MAKDVHDREDLLREATGYVDRMEFRLPPADQPLFSGFRAEGAWSLYWGQDEVIQFNLNHELRRAFWHDRPLACYRRQLHWLHRRPTAAAKLTREPMPADEQAAFLSLWEHRLAMLRRSLETRDYLVVGQVPAEGDVAAKTLEWLVTHHGPIQLAMHPGVATT